MTQTYLFLPVYEVLSGVILSHLLADVMRTSLTPTTSIVKMWHLIPSHWELVLMWRHWANTHYFYSISSLIDTSFWLCFSNLTPLLCKILFTTDYTKFSDIYFLFRNCLSFFQSINVVTFTKSIKEIIFFLFPRSLLLISQNSCQVTRFNNWIIQIIRSMSIVCSLTAKSQLIIQWLRDTQQLCTGVCSGLATCVGSVDWHTAFKSKIFGHGTVPSNLHLADRHIEEIQIYHW